MTSLDTYLRGPHDQDEAFRQTLLRVIEDVLPLFDFKRREQDLDISLHTTWPYAEWDPNLKRKGAPNTAKGGFSMSTHCMILFALNALLPRKGRPGAIAPHAVLLGRSYRANKKWKKDVKKAVETITSVAVPRLMQKVNEAAGAGYISSGLFGKNDPFTLSWLADLVFRFDSGPGITGERLTTIDEAVFKFASHALAKEPEALVESDDASDPLREVECSFVTLHRLQLAETLKLHNRLRPDPEKEKWITDDTSGLWDAFDASIHRQLSYAATGDPKFDPAELAFALEGSLLIQATWITRSTVEKIFDALKLRDHQHYWQAKTPFLSSQRGEALFVASIEVANSILRSCEILADDVWPDCFSYFEPQMRKFSTWLLEEREEFETKDKTKLVGWHTDHAVNQGLIQTWHTSHVLLFMAQYERQLKRKIAADGQAAAGLSVKRYKTLKEEDAKRRDEELKEFWQNEPLSELAAGSVPTMENSYAVMRNIRTEFIDRRLPSYQGKDEDDKFYSMLLYGPPGTGKTTVAENLAESLKRTLITVTVSDFLAAGSAEIENRAKGLFEVLGSQEDTIILFDEIDQFLLDRSSAHYRAQGDVFKFMTPGMLTKLQNLRDAKSSIFILATNYYERIDSAIKRSGRVDVHYLLCLPDSTRRRELLHWHWEKEWKEKPPTEFDQAVLDQTVFLGWGDIKTLVKKAGIKGRTMKDKAFNDHLIELAKNAATSTNLPAYRSRFDRRSDPATEEFALLVYLLAQARVPTDAEKNAIIHVVKKIDSITNGFSDLYMSGGRIVKSEDVTGKIDARFRSIIDEAIAGR